jgi:hypothetical protein
MANNSSILVDEIMAGGMIVTHPASTPSPHAAVSPNTTTGAESETNIVIVGALIALIIVLSAIFLFLALPPLVSCVRAFWPISQKRVNSRYETIEGWLITKVSHVLMRLSGKESELRDQPTSLLSLPVFSFTLTNASINLFVVFQRVRAHDDTCECDDKFSKKKADKFQPSESHDTADTEEECNECSICMCNFNANEIVSWSPNAACNHLYHHECIKGALHVA